jgi:hypothetical protein
MNGKLFIELVPKTCHFSNVRTLLPKKEWDKLRKASYEVAGNVCEICGDTGKNQGYNHNVECHEIWDYDDDAKVQKLLGLISLCPRCHQVKHFGRASVIGKQAEAFEQLEKVNGWSHRECVKHAGESSILYLERSKYKWYLDLSILTEEFEVDKELIIEAEEKRNGNKII